MFNTKTINRGIILFSLVSILATPNSFALTAKFVQNTNVVAKQSVKQTVKTIKPSGKQYKKQVTPKQTRTLHKESTSLVKVEKAENFPLSKSVSLELAKNSAGIKKVEFKPIIKKHHADNQSEIIKSAELSSGRDTVLVSNKVASKPVIKPIKKVESKVKVSYRVLSEKNGKPGSAIVYIGGKEVLVYTTSANGLVPEKRAKILADRLQYFINKNGNPNEIMPGMKNGIPICRANGEMLFTINVESAKAERLPVSALTLKWVNNIRQALGAPGIVRDYTRIASRSGVLTSFSREIVGNSEIGMASWYGGKFHGKRSADGTRFSTYEYTAAHKTLPFGSVVKVTNLNNSKFCYVRISDRGPFIDGRVIDLSKAAAIHLNMISTGVAKVKIETIREF